MTYTKAELSAVRALICDVQAQSDYDHRPFMPRTVREKFPHMMEDSQLDYSRFKLAVSKVLQPKYLLEIGIGWGVSAKAFLEGYPSQYLGIDNGEMGVPPADVLPQGADFYLGATDSLPSFDLMGGPIDLIHIDGGHGRDQKCRDLVKAFEARPEWILIDDFADAMVFAGTALGVWKACRNGLRMLYFENSHTGSLLLHIGRQEPEYRD